MDTLLKQKETNMHHEEGIVIVGGGFGGLCFAAALHKYIITPWFSNYYYDFMRI
jgi:NADH dehydrogenase FAD-containing subunit